MMHALGLTSLRPAGHLPRKGGNRSRAGAGASLISLLAGEMSAKPTEGGEQPLITHRTIHFAARTALDGAPVQAEMTMGRQPFLAVRLAGRVEQPLILQFPSQPGASS